MWSYPNPWMLVAVTALSLMTATTGQATTSIQQSAVVEVDQATVNQILGVFHKADAAIAAENLDGLMALYATQYNYPWVETARCSYELVRRLRDTVISGRCTSF